MCTSLDYAGREGGRGNRKSWASGRESPFMSSSAIQRQQASASTPVPVHVHTPSKPHPKCSNSPLTRERRAASLRSEEANDDPKDSFFKKFVALYFSLFAHVLLTLIVALCKYALFCSLHCLARTGDEK